MTGLYEGGEGTYDNRKHNPRKGGSRSRCMGCCWRYRFCRWDSNLVYHPKHHSTRRFDSILRLYHASERAETVEEGNHIPSEQEK
jgi:hypothetical protein